MKTYIRNIYKATSIKIKWRVFIAILIIYPIVLIGFGGYKNYDKVITKHFVKAVEDDVIDASKQMSERMDDLGTFVKEIQYDNAIHNFTQDYYRIIRGWEVNESKEAVMENYELAQKVEGYLMSITLSKPEISLGAYQFVGQEDMGYVVSKVNSHKEEQEFINNKVYKSMKDALGEENTTAYYVDEGKNIHIGQKIFNRHTSRQSGMIIFKINSHYLLGEYTKMLEDSKEAIAIMVEDEIELLGIGNLTKNRKNKLMKFISMNPDENRLYKEENKSEVVIYNKLDSNELELASAVFISKDTLLSDIRIMSRYIFLLCISTIPIFYLLANKLYKEVIYPVYVLSDKMHQIENGRMGVSVESDRRDEFGYLFTAFNKMSHQIQYLINRVYKEQLALKNAELKALQAQINPHFLYNTLEMINWKARIAGNDDIVAMIEALSGIMEINIDRRDSKFLSIKDEIRYLDNYMFLIEKRFGKKIQYKADIEECTLDFKIPRLIIQPLVENAIGHGIEPKGKGTITVRINRNADKLVISIEDDGVGIDYNELYELNQKINGLNKIQHNELEDRRESIGVINIQKRIKLLYGLKYGIAIQSQLNQGTSIVLTLPVTLTGEL